MHSLLDHTLSRNDGATGSHLLVSSGEWTLWGIVIALSLLVAGTFVATAGNVMATSAVVVALAIVFLSFYRVDLSFYLFIGMVLLFDQFIVVPFGDPITDAVHYFDNLKQMPFLPAFSEGVMNPLEIQLALMLFGMFLALAAKRTLPVQSVPMWGLALVFLLSLLSSLAYGLATNGDLLPALWEIRALFYFLLLYFLVPQIIQTRQQINVLLWIFVIVIAVKDLQGTVRFAALGFRFQENPCLTNHEDPVFTVDLVMFLIALAILGMRVRIRTILTSLLPVFLLGFYAGNRRAAYAGFMVCLFVLLVVLQKSERRRLLRFLIPAFVFVICYSAVFWNNAGRLGSPVQMIKSGIFEDKADDGSHYSSNLYRKLERFDLASTVRKSPLVGTGFGKKYEQPIPLVPIPFPLRDWIPHDEILWLVVKTGAIGFFVFCLFINGLLFETSSISASIKDPFLKALCILIAVAIVNQVVVSYFDLQLTYYRNMVFLGTLCGLIPTVRALGRDSNTPRKTPPPPSSKLTVA